MLKKILLFTSMITMLVSISALAKNAEPKDKDNYRKGTIPFQSGLLTNYANITVNNLPIGYAISMKKIASRPLVIENKYPTDIYVSITPTVPTEDKLLKGFEPIPSADWIKLEAVCATINAESKFMTDVVIDIPNDEKYLGKKFQVGIDVETPGKPLGLISFGYHLGNRLSFTIAKQRNDKEYKEALKNPPMSDFIFEPEVVRVFNAKAGTKVDVKNENNQPVLLKNDSKKKVTFYVASVDSKKTYIIKDGESQLSKTPVDDIKLGKEEITVKPGKAAKLNFEVNIPKDVDLSKGPLFYLLSAKAGTQRTTLKYLRIFIYGGDRPENSWIGDEIERKKEEQDKKK